jgi:glycosyltransferase involved in cell wall biosynthesis
MARGLVENHIRVKVICIKPTKYFSSLSNLAEIKKKGNFKGIEYEYTSLTLKDSRFLLGKAIHLFMGWIRSFFYIFRENSNNNIDAIIVNFQTVFFIFSYYILSKLIGAKYISEINEYPKRLRKSSLPLHDKIISSFAYKPFDGLIVITNALEEYFRSKIKRNSRIIIIPILVETDRFDINKKIDHKNSYIAYCGSIAGNKDGVPILIKSFAFLISNFPNLILYIIGSSSNSEDLYNLKELVSTLGIQNSVNFCGVVHRDKMPELLSNATILALARPSSLQAKGGFPTKLGEYLATGNPVVITKVGEIPYYLKDGKNAFLVKPNNVEAFAEKLKYVLNNPELALKVGMEGKELAKNEFNYKVQSIKLIQFLSELTE